MAGRVVVLVERTWWLLGLLLVAVLVLVDLGLARQINGTYAAGAVLAAILCGPRRTLAVAVVAVVASAASGAWGGNWGQGDWAVRFVACCLLAAVAVAAAVVNDRRQERLHAVTEMAQRVLDALAVELTGARTVREVAEGFVGHAVDALGARSAMVMTLDRDDVLRTVTWKGRGGPQADGYQEIPLGGDLPGAAAVRERRDLHYRSLREIEDAFPGLAGYFGSERSLHVLPLVHDDRARGLLALTFRPGSFTASQEGFLRSLAGALSGAMARAEELQRADAAQQRTALLAEASMTLARSLDMDATLAEVGRLLVPRFADWCAVHLLSDGRLETVTIQHRDEETAAWARSMVAAFPTRMDAPSGAPHVLRTGRSELHPFIPEELVDAVAVNEEHRDLLRRLGMTSAIVAPLQGRQGVLGAVTLIHAESGRRYDEADLAFLEAVAARVALAVDTAATFEQQSERLAGVRLVAEAAQRAILAPPPPRAGHLALSARYLSAAAEAQVGGDLHETVVTPDRVRLLVGDVRGKGLTAVRTATVVLGEFRAAAAGPGDVAHVAREIDGRLPPYLLDVEDFVTAVLVDVEPDGRTTVVSCGHPAPVVLTATGELRTLDLDHSPPLGLGAAPSISEVRLAPGDRILLHTDGLVEARTEDGGFVDPAPFLAEAAGAPFDAALDVLLDGLRRATGHALGDDLALLLACYDPQDPPQ